MDRARQVLSGPGGLFVRFVFLLLGLYLAYNVYNFLYSIPEHNDYLLTNNVVLAGTPTTKEIYTIKTTNKIANMVTGLDFSVSYWMYVSGSSSSVNQLIFSIGLDPENATPTNSTSMIAYLSAYNYNLAIRTNARRDQPAGGNTPTQNPLNSTELNNLFNIPVTPSNISDPITPCDITSVDLQKWVHVAIVSSGKTLDVYMDGKLARSCILDGNIRFQPNTDNRDGPSENNKLILFAKGGFQGYLSNFRTHDYSLNPEQIWRFYMEGPGPKLKLWDYIKSLWDPKSVGTLDYPTIKSG